MHEIRLGLQYSTVFFFFPPLPQILVKFLVGDIDLLYLCLFLPSFHLDRQVAGEALIPVGAVELESDAGSSVIFTDNLMPPESLKKKTKTKKKRRVQSNKIYYN